MYRQLRAGRRKAFSHLRSFPMSRPDTRTRMTADRAHGLGRIGIWSLELRFGDPAVAVEATAELDELGYGAIWIPGGIGGDFFADLGRLLDAAPRIAIASGILNIYKHEPADVGAWWHGLSETEQSRLMIGLGVSHGPLIGKDYRKPLGFMGEYLDALDEAGAPQAHRCLAALGPKMLELSRDRTAGAHPYLVTPEHTASARAILGDGVLLAPEQGIILETDPTIARGMARKALENYLHLPNYVNSWRRLGFSEEDFGQGSDRLVDRLFAWGSLEQIAARLDEHFAAGADHVCLQVIHPGSGTATAPRAEWRALAGALL
jgi:probable F420-dependent oxidoreductase